MPYDGISFQTKRALMELDREAQPPPAEPPTNYTPGSTLREEYAKSKGLTLDQLKAQQDAQFRALMKKRKAQGYAKGGAIKGALNVLMKRFKHPLSQASQETYSRLATQLAKAPLDGLEYGILKTPGAESQLIKGTPTEVPFGKDPLFKEALNEELVMHGDNPRQWPIWGTGHTHPLEGDETWQDLPLSSGDLTLFTRLPKGGRHLILHPEDQILEAEHILDMPELQRLAKSRGRTPATLFNQDYYRLSTSKMKRPDELRDVNSAIMRSLPLTLQKKDIMDVSNSGDEASDAIFRQFAEDWAKKHKFAGGGLIKGEGVVWPFPRRQ